ncbi:MAG: TolC family protein [Kiritimatiellia bacterium]|jgi:outer membrane protein TolC
MNRYFGVVLAGILIVGNVWGAARDDLQSLVAAAMEWNPRVRAAVHQLEQANAARAELRGFFDPQLSAGGEYRDSVYGRRETLLQAGVHAPALPGVYLDAAAEEHFFDQMGDLNSTSLEYERLIQSRLWLGLNVPLLQDRGWRKWRLEDLQAQHAAIAADRQLLAVRQEVRRDIEQQYFNLLEAQALINVAVSATERAEKLLKEAEAMVSVQALPEYQVYAARSAAALRREEALAIIQNYDVAGVTLNSLVGAPTPVALSKPELDDVINWAMALQLPEQYRPEEILASRGSYARIMSLIDADRAACDLAKDRLRSRLSLVFEATFQGEDPDDLIATGRYLSSRNAGVLAGVVWSRPWDYRAEKASVRAKTAQLAEQNESLRQAGLTIVAELATAHKRFIAAHGRLREASDAVAAARSALESEDERFRLGEGRSRNVLDAQKDLTDALKRQIVAGVELLRAYYAFDYAAGYGLVETGVP